MSAEQAALDLAEKIRQGIDWPSLERVLVAHLLDAETSGKRSAIAAVRGWLEVQKKAAQPVQDGYFVKIPSGPKLDLLEDLE